jgi:hypothetical protein
MIFKASNLLNDTMVLRKHSNFNYIVNNKVQFCALLLEIPSKGSINFSF